MAKNLKFNIKNTQLAAVLKKSQVKKETPKEEDAPSGQAAVSQKGDVKSDTKIVRAKKSPQFVEDLKKEEAPVLPPPVVVEELPPPAPLPPSVPEVVAAPPPPAPTPSVAPVVSEAPATTKAKEEEPVDKKKKKGEKEFEEDNKNKKPVQTQKRQSFSRVFDSRDRSGLRTGEDESWRRRRHGKQKIQRPPESIQRPKEISVTLPVNVKDLAVLMKLKASEVIQKLFLQGLPVTINDDLEDLTIVQLIGEEFGVTIHIDTSKKERLQITGKSIDEEISGTAAENLMTRPPVVTIMGHVDHGKTSIIDAFRKSNLIAGEAGAITQHIGAFQVKTKHGSFTVLDTPGHEAFSEIRRRGAHVTDIIVLVIAGDEGIKPQTEEAITKAKEANVPVIVAINKMDKPGFNADNIYRELTDHGLLPEAWGGEVITINCSAKTKAGIEQLGEMIALQSEILELTANPTERARGTVLESELHCGLGPTATLLVQNGTLRVGDAVIFEYEYGRIKTMQDEHGVSLKEAPPSAAVKVTGLSGVPLAGNEFISMENEKEARKITEERKASMKRKQLLHSKAKDIEHLFKEKEAQKQRKILNIIVKADVGGSLEAVKQSLLNIPTDKVEINFITAEVGQISESDIELAQISNALILGFHTKIESHAESLIKMRKVKILQNDVIYHLVDAVKAHMLTLLDKIRQENLVGEAKVIATFKSSQLGLIAGCKVVDGLIKRSHYARIYRDNELVWEGNIVSLKRHQDDVKEVKKDLECGIVLGKTSNIAIGDFIKTYEITYIDQEL